MSFAFSKKYNVNAKFLWFCSFHHRRIKCLNSHAQGQTGKSLLRSEMNWLPFWQKKTMRDIGWRPGYGKGIVWNSWKLSATRLHPISVKIYKFNLASENSKTLFVHCGKNKIKETYCWFCLVFQNAKDRWITWLCLILLFDYLRSYDKNKAVSRCSGIWIQWHYTAAPALL